MTRALRAVLGFTLDVLILAAVAIAMLVVAGRGGRFHVGGWDLSVTSIRNPVTVAVVAAVVRSALVDVPFLAVVAVAGLRTRSLAWWRSVCSSLTRMDARTATRWVITGIVASLAVKLAIAYLHPGFWTGDDVEVHEMTLSRIFGWSVRAWDLRSPFYPLGIIYPAQWIAHAGGVTDPGSLVFVGRSVVALFSVATLWLTFRIAFRIFDSLPIAIISVAVLAVNKLHTIGGTTELPRTVSSCLVLSAFGLLCLSKRDAAAILAGILIAVAAAMRFSEEIFLLPAVLQLVVARRWRHGVLLLGAFAAGAGVIMGAVDRAYWGEPFYSLRHIVDFTLVKGLSSRGYQPVYEYLRVVPMWTDVVTLGLAVLAWRLRLWTLMAWTWLPVLVLSALPHKEPRYLIPVLPYFAMLAAATLWSIIGWLNQGADARRLQAAPVVAAALAAAVAAEASGYVVARSNGAVAMARFVAAQGTPGGVALEQAWKLGGRIYLPTVDPYRDMDALEVEDTASLSQSLEDTRVSWIALQDRHFNDASLERRLLVAGFHDVTQSASAPESGYRLFRRLR